MVGFKMTSKAFSFDDVVIHYDQEIGEGSGGTRVYAATWQGNQTIAVKRVPFSSNQSHQKQYQKEYEFMQQNIA